MADTISVGVDRIQRNFKPMQRQVKAWRQTQISDTQAKLIFYSAFVDGKLEDCPKSIKLLRGDCTQPFDRSRFRQ